MSGGLELSFVSESEAWSMFDTLVASAVPMPGPLSSFDTDVSELILSDPIIKPMVEDLIRDEYERKDWIKK